MLLHGASAAVQTGRLPGRWSGPGRPTNQGHEGAVGQRLLDRVRAVPTATQQPILSHDGIVLEKCASRGGLSGV